MPRLPAVFLLGGLTLGLAACGGIRRDGPEVAAEAMEEHAAMVLSYPHDEHAFGELPPNLKPVSGASAYLVREADRVRGVVETRITPGHVGKLLAVVINNPSACTVPTPATACGPHEEEFNMAADGGFYLGDGAVAGPDGSIALAVTVRVGDGSNVLCGGAANPDFDACRSGFALRDARGAEVTLVVLDNGQASDDPAVLARQFASASSCPSCPPFTAQIAIGFGREPPLR